MIEANVLYHSQVGFASLQQVSESLVGDAAIRSSEFSPMAFLHPGAFAGTHRFESIANALDKRIGLT
jgi:hypothetical protein